MSDEVPKARKAKIIGNSNRQVAAFIDNQPSSTSSNSSSEKMNKSGATDNDVDNFGSPIPSPSVSQQPPTSNEIDSPTIENQESVSSISQPQGPQPGQLALDVPEANIEYENTITMPMKKKSIAATLKATQEETERGSNTAVCSIEYDNITPALGGFTTDIRCPCMTVILPLLKRLNTAQNGRFTTEYDAKTTVYGNVTPVYGGPF
ncbi:unnamed protein product [Rotaria magnacalcarata]|uniref:Uncharacterized protein n=1 Tax=Rotaria magnacalcarata TaxID=392030 RepID=A0A816DZR8_9BILA|nr:unnamed protein product [Rotaria magnacalcarata]CAF4137591.1 unnamed protein product [Rotaria magnacalcarata]